MSEFELVVPPKENIFARIIHIETTQKNVGYFQRAVVRKVMNCLNNTLQDAAFEIAIAKTLYDGPGGYRLMSYGRVTGMGPQELSNYKITIKKRYEEWCRAMAKNPETLAITLAFCQDEDSIDVIRKRHRISEHRATWRLICALNEYSIRAGWGSQIREP